MNQNYRNIVLPRISDTLHCTGPQIPYIVINCHQVVGLIYHVAISLDIALTAIFVSNDLFFAAMLQDKLHPALAALIPLSIMADKRQGHNQFNKFEYYIANNTTGKSASGYVELDASKQFDGTTVEWVVERCKSGGSLTSLGDYGTMTMKNCKATLNSSNTWLNLGNLSNLYKVTMIGYGGNTLSSPGSISSGTQFTCTFKDYS